MNKFFGFLTFASLAANNLFAAEAGMPQLDPTYWASQVFWLTIIFASIPVNSLGRTICSGTSVNSSLSLPLNQ